MCSSLYSCLWWWMNAMFAVITPPFTSNCPVSLYFLAFFGLPPLTCPSRLLPPSCPSSSFSVHSSTISTRQRFVPLPLLRFNMLSFSFCSFLVLVFLVLLSASCIACWALLRHVCTQSTSLNNFLPRSLRHFYPLLPYLYRREVVVVRRRFLIHSLVLDPSFCFLHAATVCFFQAAFLSWVGLYCFVSGYH